MNPKKIQQQKATPKPAKAPLKKEDGGSLFNNLDAFCTKNAMALFITACISTVLFSLLLFDVKMSNANDDSMYIESAWKFSKDYHNFHVANAPLYPMFLSIFISLFGLKVIMLKAINVVFICLQIVLLFYGLRKHVQPSVLFPVLFIVAFNSFYMYFGSQTFTEAMFCSLQALFILFLVKHFEKQQEDNSLKNTWRNWLIIGLMLFLLSIMKNIAVVAPLILTLFYLLKREWISSALAMGSFLLFRLPFELIKKIVWSGINQYSNQGSIITQKDPYDPSKGMETFSGYMTRIIDNSNLYISKRFFQILSFKSPDSTETNFGLVLIFAIILGVAIYQIIKNKNTILSFISLYVIVMMGATFAGLQVQWDQTRFILVYVSLILMVFLAGYYYMLSKYSSFAQFSFVIVVFVIFGSSIISTIRKSADNFPILKENLSGNIYFGYTEDWINYLRMSEYCADSLPPETYVAARKAPMSFIYAKGKEFYPVYTVFADSADSVLATFKKEKVTHVIVASLRRNPVINDGQIINTMQRLLYPITQKYPQKLLLVKQIGDIEPAYLYKINY